MYHCWSFIICILSACNAQEHLICLRTDDVINPSPNKTTTNVQGRPGRLGPQGPKGDSIKGMKGEPGISDQSLVESLRNTSVTLQEHFSADTWNWMTDGYLRLTDININ